jgi:hypothetical protein
MWNFLFGFCYSKSVVHGQSLEAYARKTGSQETPGILLQIFLFGVRYLDLCILFSSALIRLAVSPRHVVALDRK